MKQINDFLKYITNNEDSSKHEEQFDKVFFIVNTIALIVGIWWLIKDNNGSWIPFLVIEYVWALDNMRHNRS